MAAVSRASSHTWTVVDDTPAPVTCTWCGTQAADGAPVTWTVQTGPRGLEYLCEACTRDNARNIESGLSTEYW